MTEPNFNVPNSAPSNWLTELGDRACSTERQEEILLLLEAEQLHNPSARPDFARALAFRLNRDTNWKRRLERLETLRQLAFQKDAPSKIRLLYAQAIFHRLNAEVELSKRQICGEALKELALSTDSTPEIQLVAAQGVLNCLRTASDLAQMRQHASFLRLLSRKPNALTETYDSYAAGLFYLLKSESNLDQKWRLLTEFTEFWTQTDHLPTVTLFYAKALAHAVMMARNPTQKCDFMAALDTLPIPNEIAHKSVREGILLSQADALSHLLVAETSPTARRSWLERLATLAAERFPTLQLQEIYARGLSLFLEKESDEKIYFQNAAILKSMAERSDVSPKIAAQYAMALIHRLQITENPLEAANCLRYIADWSQRNGKSTDARCLYGCALLLTMRWESETSKKLERARLLGDWKSGQRGAFSERFQASLQFFLSHEKNVQVRQAVLSSVR